MESKIIWHNPVEDLPEDWVHVLIIYEYYDYDIWHGPIYTQGHRCGGEWAIWPSDSRKPRILAWAHLPDFKGWSVL